MDTIRSCGFTCPLKMSVYTDINIYVSVCVCVCVRMMMIQ